MDTENKVGAVEPVGGFFLSPSPPESSSSCSVFSYRLASCHSCANGANTQTRRARARLHLCIFKPLTLHENGREKQTKINLPFSFRDEIWAEVIKNVDISVPRITCEVTSLESVCCFLFLEAGGDA